MNQLKVKQWIERQLWDDRDEGPATKFVLKHLDSNGRAGRIEIWSKAIEHNAKCVIMPEDEIPDLINEIGSASFDDAEGMAAGLQRYQLLCFVKHKPHAHSRFTFSTSAGTDDVDDTGVSEPATHKGLLGQMMRHNEALMRTTVMSSNQTLGMLARTVANQGEHIEKLLKDRREGFETMEDLKSQRHDRELSTIEATNREERYQAMFEKAQLLLPALVNRVSGKKLLPESTTPMEEMLKTLAESFTEAQISAIMPTLKPEQQVVLVQFMEASQGETKQLASKTSNGKN